MNVDAKSRLSFGQKKLKIFQGSLFEPTVCITRQRSYWFLPPHWQKIGHGFAYANLLSDLKSKEDIIRSWKFSITNVQAKLRKCYNGPNGDIHDLLSISIESFQFILSFVNTEEQIVESDKKLACLLIWGYIQFPLPPQLYKRKLRRKKQRILWPHCRVNVANLFHFHVTITKWT